MKAENLYHTAIVVDNLDAAMDWFAHGGRLHVDRCRDRRPTGSGAGR